MLHNDGIRNGLKGGLAHGIIARKIYLSFPVAAFDGEYEAQFEITNAIKNEFELPFSSIKVAGSAQTGFSYHQNRDFLKKESDLDIAIIDKELFYLYMEIVYEETKGFSDLSKFPKIEGIDDTFQAYSQYINKGIFRPDMMPYGDYRTNWFKFFREMSKGYKYLFSNINAAIYLSEFFFEEKQSRNIEIFKKDHYGKI